MNARVDDLISDWLDDLDQNVKDDIASSTDEEIEAVAESLLVHGLLVDASRQEEGLDAERIRRVLQRIDSDSRVKTTRTETHTPPRNRHRFAVLTSALAIAAAVMMMFVFSGPNQSVSAAMASLQKVVEAAAKPLDRTYGVSVVDEYPRDKRPRNLPPEAWRRESEKQLDGATIYVRGANQYVMKLNLKSGDKRTIGCDGNQSWALRENGPVRISTNLSRFRGGVPGARQEIPFLNIHAQLSQLQTGYEIQHAPEEKLTTEESALSGLVGVRKSRDVRGPKRVEIWFHPETGTVHRMLLDGLPRGGGGPKSLMLELIDQSDLNPSFFSHEAHHEPGRPIVSD